MTSALSVNFHVTRKNHLIIDCVSRQVSQVGKPWTRQLFLKNT